MDKSLTEAITEEDFLELAQERSQDFLRISNFLYEDHMPFTRRFYAHLIKESEELESFLDDYSARDNKTWYFFGELVACTRNIAKVAFIITHVLNRFSSYPLKKDEADSFIGDAQNVSRLLDETVLSLYEGIKCEAQIVGIKFQSENVKEDLFGEVYPQKRLPYTIDEEDDLDVQKIVVKIATEYLIVIEKFAAFGWDSEESHLGDPRDAIPDKINEEMSRELVALIHNLQSSYDHSVRRTPLETKDKGLRKLRGHISIPLHLLSIVNWLSHLYQRHVLALKYDKARDRITAILEASDMFSTVMNFALHYTNSYLETGKELANDILAKYTERDTCELRVPQKLGFHLRPATLVAKCAKYYGTKVYIIIDGHRYDASNVLNITLAGGLIARKGYETVLFEGDKRVLKDLKLLSECNYGENETGSPTKPPPELSHLWE
jgi:phosphotransferase system HPr-like phosphotransfer protein